MAATRTNAVDSDDVLASLGGTLTADDDLIFGYPWAKVLINSPDQDGTVINSLSILPANKNNFGSPQVALQFQIDTAATSLLFIGGSGSFFSFRSSSVAEDIENVIFDPANGAARGYLDTCDTERLTMRAGDYFEVGASCDLANAYMQAGRSVFAYSASLALTLLQVTRKHHAQVGRDATTLTVMDDGIIEGIHEQLTPTTLNVRNRGRFTGRVGNIGTVNLEGDYPILDLTKVAAAMAITALNIFSPHEIWIPKNGPTITIPSATVELWPRKIVHK